ncbi:MAG: ABC transporter ATP-binding protein [Acidobacteria bacterium]|nr:ABC transporter ATP-binding protein [Acidobacteriota bacterium]
MISTFALTKYYETIPAVKNVDLFIGAGEICGLIGPNGAGKTTVLKMLAGLLLPTSGRIEIAGEEVGAEPKKLHSFVGYLPDNFGLYDELTVWQFLDYFANAQKVERQSISSRIEKVLDLTRLVSKRNALVGTLSRGMRQRVLVAKTLLGHPKVLLFDEPASGLDPLARKELCELIKMLGSMGQTIVVSSHILSELADFCTSVAIMEQGRLVRSGRINEIVEKISTGILVCIEMMEDLLVFDNLAATLRQIPEIQNISLSNYKINFTFLGSRTQLVELHRQIVLNHSGIISFYEKQLTVEDVFMAVSSHRTS